MQNRKRESGITTIALTITIILMLILIKASVTILAGSGEVVTESQDTVNAAQLESLKEAVREELKQKEIQAKITGVKIESSTIQAIADEYNNRDNNYYVNYNPEENIIEITNGNIIDLSEFGYYGDE